MGASEQGADATNGRWLTIPRTLSFVLNGSDVLLMKRAPHKRIFPNRYNGVGGHIERDEDPYSSARREIIEETGLQIGELNLRAIYNVDAGQATGIMLLVFTCLSIGREVRTDCAEGSLHWIPRRDVMQLDLVEDLPDVLPRILDRPAELPPLYVHVSYDEDDVMRLRFAEP